MDNLIVVFTTFLEFIFHLFLEKGDGKHQQPTAACDEIRKMCAWFQADVENIETRKGETSHHC